MSIQDDTDLFSQLKSQLVSLGECLQDEKKGKVRLLKMVKKLVEENKQLRAKLQTQTSIPGEQVIDPQFDLNSPVMGFESQLRKQKKGEMPKIQF